jgi:hypothetical protein
MRYLASVASFLLITALDLPLAAQYSGGRYPGGGYPYPGGGYPTGPSIPIPRRSKDKKADEKSKQPQLQSLTGVLRKIDDTSVTIAAKDTRIITAKRGENMKVFKKGEESAAAKLNPGDHVRIDATQDDHGFYSAVAIYVDAEATPQERTAAEAATTPSIPNSADDEDRPVLRRQPGPSEQGTDGEKAESAPVQQRAATTVVTAPNIADELDPDRPRTRRGKPAPRKTPAPETVTSGASAPAPTSPARSEPQVVASNAPRPEAERSGPTGPREDERIAKAREVLAAYNQSLPNYFCQEHIARMVSTTQKGDWRPLDIVSATVVFENGRDEYRNLTINGKPVNKRMEDMEGAWSTGEFGLIAADLFSLATAADFTRGGSSKTGAHDAVVYDFEVDREHSHWNIQAPSQSVRPAYKGSVWLKPDTAEILRIEMQTDHMPKEFPLDKVESAVDYDYVRLGEHQFLLPVHAETLTCVRGSSDCSRNVIDFRNYRKYAGESTITFDK